METYIKVNENEVGDIVIDTPMNGRLVISEKNNSFFIYTDLQENTTFDFMYVANENTGEVETKRYKELLEDMDVVSVFNKEDIKVLVKTLEKMIEEE